MAKKTKTESLNLNISEILRKGRLRKGLTQKELSDLMNVQPSLISKWENTDQVPRGDYLIQLANILDVVFDLFPNYKKYKSPEDNSYQQLKDEIDGLWKAIRKKDEEEADLKKILLLLLKDKLGVSGENVKSLV